jgi:hypothetical protein
LTEINMAATSAAMRDDGTTDRGDALVPKTQEAGGACLPGSRGPVDPSRCHPMAGQKRKPASASKERPVKTTLSLDVDLHSRLAAMASRRRMGMSALAEQFIRAGLRGFVVIDRSESSDRGTANDRRTEGLAVSDSDGEAA